MAKKLEDKFYDIRKATALVTVQKTFGKKYGDNVDDDWVETLFVKKSGEYFLYGMGGKNSPFSNFDDGVSTQGDGYETWLSNNYKKAKEWVMMNCPEKMDEIFVPLKPEEETKLKASTFSLTEKARANLKRRAAEYETSQSQLICQWAENFYD